jgi:hypothetical protein
MKLTQNQNIISMNPYVKITLFFNWSKPETASRPAPYPPAVPGASMPQAEGLLWYIKNDTAKKRQKRDAESNVQISE